MVSARTPSGAPFPSSLSIVDASSAVLGSLAQNLFFFSPLQMQPTNLKIVLKNGLDCGFLIGNGLGSVAWR